MKILIGMFTNEANEHIPYLADINDFDLAFGNETIRKLNVESVFQQADVELIPTIYASSGANGVIARRAFDYIERVFVEDVKKYLHEIDGIYFHLHGASEVEGLGSGDHHILREIRKIVGEYLPIAIVCDPHGNLCQSYIDDTTIIRSYRESPHIDAQETKERVAQLLIDVMKKRQNIRPVYKKLPLILGGEQSVSTDEPVLSINRYMDKIEEEPRIMSCSWHVGYLRHDTDVAGCGIVVVPATADDYEYAEQEAEKLADFVWSRRHEFHYTGITKQPREALKEAIAFNGKPVFITDSGDNTTSGARGWNTYILRQILESKNLNDKKFLIANINDPDTYDYLSKMSIGEKTRIELGVGYDQWSKKTELNVTIKAKGELRGYMMHDHSFVPGYNVTVSIEDYPVDVVIANASTTMCEAHQFKAAKIDWQSYDVIVVKQGYAFPWIKEVSELAIMSLTNGPTPQDTRAINFKRIMRPMFPIDDI